MPGAWPPPARPRSRRPSPPGACKDQVVEEGTTDAEILWAPTPEMIERSQLARYLRWLAENRDLHFEDYHTLWRWSVTEIQEFWGTLWEYFEVIADPPYEEVLK